MLHVPHGAGELQLIATNAGADYTAGTFGTTITAHADAHTKGTAVEVIADTLVTDDVYLVAIEFVGGQVAASSRIWLADLLVDPAGGTSYSTLIANLAVCGPSSAMCGNAYVFPLFIKSGTTIGMQAQSNAAGSRSFQVVISLYGKPAHPWAWKTGQYVETIGADTATTAGVAVTPGTAALGSYSSSLGTLAKPAWWWQLGVHINDSTTSPGGPSQGYFGDLAVGDASNKILAIEHLPFCVQTSEALYKGAFGRTTGVLHAPAAVNVYCRMACQGTPDSSISAIAYAVGG